MGGGDCKALYELETLLDVVFYVCWTIVFGLFLVSTQLASLFPLRSLIQIVLSVVVGGTLLVYTTILFRRLNRLRAALSGSMTLLSPHNLRDTTVSSNSELRRERIGLCLLAIVEVPDPKSSVGSAEIKVLTKSASILLATRENGCVTDRGSLPRSRTDLSPTRAKSESA
ncbi:uncharacterized protein BJ171DRAFT_219117 [Polychytrium aggregatum]|uniref:uncharacterized protein n=1 Tax=Polychytrium aggregatum TaxID=110093 RepID=UPI0022FE9E63|nr:uncharacterized protein BJ171DRAFT_219117 [Polychytrium aggregatum]KAI9199256.1 hypothetical protein BJ171DRAFT_219117 [Polychytrium aggregatum]